MAQKTTIFVQSVEKDVDVFAQTDGMPLNSVTGQLVHSDP
jgi:hypothetical protein